jgi:hypothetical protein
MNYQNYEAVPETDAVDNFFTEVWCGSLITHRSKLRR